MQYNKLLLTGVIAIASVLPLVANAQGNGLRAAWRDYRDAMYTFYGEDFLNNTIGIPVKPYSSQTQYLYEPI